MMFVTKLDQSKHAEKFIDLMRNGNNLPNFTVNSLMQDHFILIKNGQLAGVTAVGRGNWFSAEIYHTHVLPEFRKQGIARALNEFAIYYAREILKKKVLTCTVRDDNEASKALVKAVGFSRACSFENEDRLINYYTMEMIVR